MEKTDIILTLGKFQVKIFEDKSYNLGPWKWAVEYYWTTSSPETLKIGHECKNKVDAVQAVLTFLNSLSQENQQMQTVLKSLLEKINVNQQL